MKWKFWIWVSTDKLLKLRVHWLAKVTISEKPQKVSGGTVRKSVLQSDVKMKDSSCPDAYKKKDDGKCAKPKKLPEKENFIGLGIST